MTKDEIRKFLDNTKVYVNGKSKEIQEKLFSFDYQWIHTCYKTVSYTNAPFLFIDNNKTLTYGIDMDFFKKNKNKEISAEEILSLEVTEPSYRPFKTKEECWQEMQKHHPFGWIKDDYKYVQILCVFKDEIECSPDEYDNGILSACDMKFTSVCEQGYTFADGEPFGIKED